MIDRDLAAQNLLRPHRRTVNTAGNLALSHGPTTHSPTEPPNSDTVCFTRKYTLIECVLRVFGAVLYVIGFPFIFIIP